MSYQKALHALSDKHRQVIVTALSAQPMTVGALSKELPISRPAVSQHVKILSDAGLVNVRAKGTRRIYSLDPSGIDALRRYLDRLWTDALDSFSKAALEFSEGENE